MESLYSEISKIIAILQKEDRTRERSLAITKLQEAQMWLDMDQKVNNHGTSN